MNPKQAALARYCADLVILSRELPEANDIRVELGRAVDELRKEIAAAEKKRAA